MPPWELLEYVALGQVANAPDRPGAYAVRYVVKGGPKHIPRIFGVDNTGILCFGESISLRRRLAAFSGAVNGNNAPHAEGQRYRHWAYHMRGIPPESLRVGWRETNSKQEAQNQEREWFQKYLDLYGELAPLNRQQPH